MSEAGGRGKPLRTTSAVSRRMRRQRTQDTAVESALRRVLHGRGLRYRVHRRPVASLRRVADLVFPKARVAVFVDGCFWHACPQHGTWPKANAAFWRSKIEGNRRRDRDTDAALMEAGWLVVRVWEHEDPEEAADRVAAAINARRSGSPGLSVPSPSVEP